SPTRRSSDLQGSIATFEEALLGRVGAMSRAHDLLAEERWHGVDLAAVVQQETEHFGVGQERSAQGPRMRLNPKAALSLALVIHELGTNALKYGALSVHEGKVALTRAIERRQKHPRLVLEWRETNGPPVTRSAHRGLGSLLIERSI